MSIHFASMTVTEITDRAHKLMQEGTALALLANALTEFEEATGRKLFVSEADQGTQYVGRAGPDRSLTYFDIGSQFGCQVSAAPAEEPQNEAVAAEQAAADTATVAETMPSEARKEVLQFGGASLKVPEGTLDKAAKKNADAIKKARLARSKPNPTTQSAASNVQKAHNAPAATNLKSGERLWGKLSLDERDVVKHIERLPSGFTVSEDLQIAELIIGGNRPASVASIMELPADTVLARWKALPSPELKGPNGTLTSAGEKQLLAALRYRKDTAA